MATTYYADIQKLYVAYFNRPADVAGLQYWETVVENAKGSTAAVSAAFAASAEYKAAYANLDAYHVVNTVYQNLFGHDADLPGLNFWAQNLIAGKFTVDQAVTAIAAGAQGTDQATYNNRVAAATAFTNLAATTTAGTLNYTGAAANAAAKAFLSGITDTASLTAAIDPAALSATVNNVSNAYLTSIGQTFTLTAGLDNFVGTAGNDVFNAYTFNAATGQNGVTNLSSYDIIDGGAGRDVLNLDLTGGSNTVTGTIKNVEIINITGATAPVDASVFQGATNINLAGGTAVEVDNLATNTVAGFSGSTQTGITVKAAGASASIAMTNTPEATGITVSGSTLSGVTISGSRADTDASGSLATQAVSITAGTDVQTVTLNTNQSTSVTLAENGASTKHITTFDASASTGKITVSGNANLLNVMTGSAADTVTVAAATSAATSSAAAVNAMVSTGAGNDTIVVNNTGTGMTTVDAGAGDDKVTVNSTTGTFSVMGGDGNDTITVAAAQMVAGNKIDGGAGTDTLAFSNNAAFGLGDYAVINAVVTNVENAEFKNAVTTLDASKLAFTGMIFDAAGAVTGVSGQTLTAKSDLTATAAGYAAGSPTTYAGNLTVTETGATSALTLNADTATVNLKASTSNGVVSTIGGDLKTSLTVNLTNSANASTSPTGDNLSSATITVNATTNTALKSVVLTGAGSVTIDASASKALSTIDASQLGGTIANGTTKGAITGGLTFTGNAAIAETITLGSGHDVVTVNSTYAKMDTIVGFDATQEGSTAASTVDTLIISQAELNGATGNLNVNGSAAALTKLTLSAADSTLDLAFVHAAASAGTNVVQFQFGGNTYLFADTNGNGTLDATDFAVKLVGTVDLSGAFATPPSAS